MAGTDICFREQYKSSRQKNIPYVCMKKLSYGLHMKQIKVIKFFSEFDSKVYYDIDIYIDNCDIFQF